MGQIIGNLIGFLSGFGFSFFMGWEFTLILMASCPVLMITLAVLIWGYTAGVKDEMKAYIQSGGYAE